MKKEEIEDINPSTNHPYLKQEILPSKVYHIAIWGLVAITIVSLVGIIMLSLHEKNYEGLVSLSSACVGGLVSIFAQKSNNS